MFLEKVYKSIVPNCSNSFEKAGRILIGLYLFVEYFISRFNIGTILGIFMLSGTVAVKNDWLKMCEKRHCYLACTVVLITITDMLSNLSLVLDLLIFCHIYDSMFIGRMHEEVTLAVISPVI